MPFSTYSFEAREPTRLTSIPDNPAGTVQNMEHYTVRPRSSSPRTNGIVSTAWKERSPIIRCRPTGHSSMMRV